MSCIYHVIIELGKLNSSAKHNMLSVNDGYAMHIGSHKRRSKLFGAFLEDYVIPPSIY
jgi:hypothetical protein